MSGTSAYTQGQAGGITLPAPNIQLAQPSDARFANANPTGLTYTVTTDGTKLHMHRMPLLTVMDVPEEAFELDLRLELLWYTKRSLRANGGNVSGYKHPSHSLPNAPFSPTGAAPIASVLPTSRFRGGGWRQVGANTVSEWSVSKNTQRFFIDTLGLFYSPDIIRYNDAGGGAGLSMYIPSCKSASGSGYSYNRNGFGYSSRFRPNYFRFRYSVQDQNDERARVTGPVSQTVVMAPAVHPFVPDLVETQAQGVTVLSINAGFRPDVFNTWFDTRLPGNQ